MSPAEELRAAAARIRARAEELQLAHWPGASREDEGLFLAVAAWLEQTAAIGVDLCEWSAVNEAHATDCDWCKIRAAAVAVARAVPGGDVP